MAGITPGALSKVLVGPSVANLASAAATGGSGSGYTYQWYRDTSSGFAPGAGNLISGATSLTLADSGLVPGTTYYYNVMITDAASAISSSATQLTVATEPSQQPNQFSQSDVVGIVDLKVGPSNVIAAQVDVSVGLAAAPDNVIYPGQAVKIVASTAGGIPKVAPCTGITDKAIGFVVFNFKDSQYLAGQNLEVALWGSVVWCYATGAITQFGEACLDVSYVGGVQAAGATATIMGWAYDGCSAAGLIRVMLLPSVAFATA